MSGHLWPIAMTCDRDWSKLGCHGEPWPRMRTFMKYSGQFLTVSNFVFEDESIDEENVLPLNAVIHA